MRLFPVPLNLTEEEKIVGGYLSLRQLLYLSTGAVIVMTALLFNIIPIYLRIIISLPVIVATGVLALPPEYMPYGISADKMVMLYAKYISREKKFYLKGDS